MLLLSKNKYCPNQQVKRYQKYSYYFVFPTLISLGVVSPSMATVEFITQWPL